MLRAFGITDKGRVRPTNEDCFGIDEALGLCVICDGMGGHNAGEVAARMAVDCVLDHVKSAARRGDWPFGFDRALSIDGNTLRTAIYAASLRIVEAAVEADAYAGMGTTIVAARVIGDRLVVAHAGDSRLYLLRSTGLAQVTSDDSWVATVLEREPDVDKALLAHHPMRNALTNVVGSRGRTDVHVAEERLQDGDLLLLTTDGVHGVLDNGRLEQLARVEQSPAAIATQIVAAALARGSRDNVTAVAARYTDDRDSDR